MQAGIIALQKETKYMSSQDYLMSRNLNQEGVILQVGTDTPVPFRLRKKTSGSVTSVIVTAATDIVMITSDGGTDTYTFATYTTVGAVVDAINSDGIFEAKVLDALRSQDVDATTLIGETISAGTDANGVVIWDAHNDTSAVLELGVTLTPHRDFDERNRRVHLHQVVYSVNMGTAAADSFQVYRRRGTKETKVFGELSVDTTETTRAFSIAGANSKGITGRENDELFVRVKDAATLADATGNFVRVYGTLE